MSIITKRGDKGQTDCLYSHKESKNSSLITAIGAVDELNAFIGLANKNENYDNVTVKRIQNVLVALMGELSARPDNFERYKKDFKKVIEQEDIEFLEAIVKEQEKIVSFKDWATPSSFWDAATRVCRRCERELYNYNNNTNSIRPEVLIYVNRLSDFLWIIARKFD